MDSNITHSLLLTFCIVIAGCGAPITDQTSPSTTPTSTQQINATTAESHSIEVVGGKLKTDPDLVFERVQKLHCSDVEPPERIVVRSSSSNTIQSSRFYSTLTGTEAVELPEVTPGGSVVSEDKIYIFPGDASSAEIEKVLAHEFAHIVQYRMSALVGTEVSPTIRNSIFQGGAIYLADEYADQYLNTSDRQSKRFNALFRESSPEVKKVYAQNYFGYRYVSNKISSSCELPRLYENPPQTTEQLIHNHSKNSEPPTSLNAMSESSHNWTSIGNETRGELFLRMVLINELDSEIAAQAASGWGNDRLFTYWSSSDKYGHVWLVQWDDAENASEFKRLFGRYLNVSANRTGQLWNHEDMWYDVERIDNRTVSVIVGPKDFVTSSTISQRNAHYTISADGNN